MYVSITEMIIIDDNTSSSQVQEDHHLGRPVMFLYHPDSEHHKTNIKMLSSCLTSHGFEVKGYFFDIFENWRDFAEKAGDVYKNVIVIVSKNFCELCALYQKRRGFNEKSHGRWEELLSERNGEYTPCIALEKLRLVYQTSQLPFKVHLVSFDTNHQYLTQAFLKCHRSFLRADNTFSYVITSEHLHSVLQYTKHGMYGADKGTAIFDLMNKILSIYFLSVFLSCTCPSLKRT